MKQFISFILPCILLIACGKGIFGPARVDGVVKDATTGETIAGATVYLLENDNSGGIFSPSISYIIDSTLSDSKGCFEFKYEDQGGYSYYVNARKEHYHDNMEQTYINDLGSGVDVEVLIHPEAFLKIHFQNIPPSTPSDNFDINGDISDGFNGDATDTSIIYLIYGNTKVELHWALLGETVYHDTIYCPAFDTTFFEVLY